ncbi:MAG: MATE family efflux transporter, partial [Clostridiales bacterium]|nr:MATE family efflux transporter [Clostridiales bacterium]
MTLAKAIEPKNSLPEARRLFDNDALKAMIVPLLIEQLLQMVVGIADTMMVSYAGEATMSGVSLDTMVYTIFIYIFTAIAAGGAVVVSQYLGRRDRAQAENAVGQVFRLSLIVSFSCMALMLLLGNTILRLLYGAVEPEVMRACRTYLLIVTLSFPANAVYNAGAALFRSMGRTRTTMIVSIAMNLVNVGGNAIGIFALHAGAAGVAWPTTISWYFAAVVMTALCLRTNDMVWLRPNAIVKHDGAMMHRILKIAVPNSVENGLFQLSKVALGSLLSTFGTAHIAANGLGQ